MKCDVNCFFVERATANIFQKKLKCHENNFFDLRMRLQKKLTTKLLFFIFRLDMCRRSHANDVCNRGTAGNFYIKQKRDFFLCFRNASSFKCLFFITLFLLFLNVFYFFSIKHQNQFFLPIHTKTNILSPILRFYICYFTYSRAANVLLSSTIFSPDSMGGAIVVKFKNIFNKSPSLDLWKNFFVRVF